MSVPGPCPSSAGSGTLRVWTQESHPPPRGGRCALKPESTCVRRPLSPLHEQFQFSSFGFGFLLLVAGVHRMSQWCLAVVLNMKPRSSLLVSSYIPHQDSDLQAQHLGFLSFTLLLFLASKLSPSPSPSPSRLLGGLAFLGSSQPLSPREMDSALPPFPHCHRLCCCSWKNLPDFKPLRPH